MNPSLLAFLHLAKTGGRSVETMLRSSLGPAYCHAIPWRRPLAPGETGRPLAIATYDADDFRRLHRLWPFMRAVGGHALTLWSGLHETRPVRYFAFLREPVARMASHYQFHVATSPRPLDLDAWCAWHEPREHQLKYFSREADPARAIAAIGEHGVFVGLLERFDESLLLLRGLLAPELNPAYRRANTAGSNRLAKELLADPASRERLASLVRGEQELYAWVRDELYPRQVAAYGAERLAADLARFAPDPSRGFDAMNDRLNRAVWKLWLGPAVRVLGRREAGQDGV